MNSIYLTLSNPIDANKFIAKVQNLIRQQKDLNDCILKVEILKINQEDTGIVPKIEYKK